MTNDERLRLIALDEEDLSLVSAHLQDAVCKVRDMVWLPREARFVVAMNRFAWEAGAEGRGRRRNWQRRRSVLHFERVERVRSAGIDRRRPDEVLDLLAVGFEPGESPSGEVVLAFAGGATLRLAVECLEAQLADLGPAWATAYAPRHSAA